MMRRLIYITALIFLSGFLCFSVCGQGDEVQSQVEEGFFSSLDREAAELLSDFGIDSLDGESLLDGSWEKLSSYFKENFTQKLKGSLSWFFIMLTALMLLSLFSSFFDFGGSGDVLSFLSVTVFTVLFISRVSPLMTAVASAMKVTSQFILSFIPVFTLLVSLSGNPVSALGYNSLILGFCQGLNALLNYGFTSFTGAYLALIISFSLNPNMNLTRFTGGVNRAVGLVMGFTSSMFAGLLSFKNIFTSNADNLASRGTRFLLSSLVPVIGSSISEAYSSLSGSINLLKSSLGVIGIFAVAVINLPTVTEGVIYYLMLCALGALSDILSLPKAGELLRGFASAVKILILAGILEGFVFIISCGIMTVTVKSF